MKNEFLKKIAVTKGNNFSQLIKTILNCGPFAYFLHFFFSVNFNPTSKRQQQIKAITICKFNLLIFALSIYSNKKKRVLNL